jgi:hypothetical protein
LAVEKEAVVKMVERGRVNYKEKMVVSRRKVREGDRERERETERDSGREEEEGAEDKTERVSLEPNPCRNRSARVSTVCKRYARTARMCCARSARDELNRP